MSLYIGLMSGTSMDAVDAVLVSFDGQDPEVRETLSVPITEALRTRLRQLARGERDELALLMELDRELGELFGEVSNRLLHSSGTRPEHITAIGSHGQTVRHYPHPPVAQTLQIADPNIIAERTGCRVVADLRRRDMAAGGQGAPLVPAFHQQIFASTRQSRAILNIGGIANLSLLPASDKGQTSGFDTGPGNTLLDAWYHRHHGGDMDHNGAWAGTGTVQTDLLEALLDESYFRLPPPKSTGPELFDLNWLETRLARMTTRFAAEDIQATLVQLSAHSISEALAGSATELEALYVCGGGALNPVLMQALREALPGLSIDSTQALGIPPTWVEAMAFAWLAHQTVHHRAGNIPEVTGAEHSVILGAVYAPPVRTRA